MHQDNKRFQSITSLWPEGLWRARAFFSLSPAGNHFLSEMTWAGRLCSRSVSHFILFSTYFVETVACYLIRSWNGCSFAYRGVVTSHLLLEENIQFTPVIISPGQILVNASGLEEIPVVVPFTTSLSELSLLTPALLWCFGMCSAGTKAPSPSLWRHALCPAGLLPSPSPGLNTSVSWAPLPG